MQLSELADTREDEHECLTLLRAALSIVRSAPFESARSKSFTWAADKCFDSRMRLEITTSLRNSRTSTAMTPSCLHPANDCLRLGRSHQASRPLVDEGRPTSWLRTIISTHTVSSSRSVSAEAGRRPRLYEAELSRAAMECSYRIFGLCTLPFAGTSGFAAREADGPSAFLAHSFGRLQVINQMRAGTNERRVGRRGVARAAYGIASRRIWSFSNGTHRRTNLPEHHRSTCHGIVSGAHTESSGNEQSCDRVDTAVALYSFVDVGPFEGVASPVDLAPHHQPRVAVSIGPRNAFRSVTTRTSSRRVETSASGNDGTGHRPQVLRP